MTELIEIDRKKFILGFSFLNMNMPIINKLDRRFEKVRWSNNGAASMNRKRAYYPNTQRLQQQQQQKCIPNIYMFNSKKEREREREGG